jgi:HAD superfamily hydrolase (TIGR01509 family)
VQSIRFWAAALFLKDKKHSDMLKAVIFDMDGVIIDSEPFHFEVNKRLFKSLKIEVSEEEYRRYIGISNTTMWTEIKRNHGLPQSIKELVTLQVNGNIDFMKSERVDPVSGVIDILFGLHKAKTLIGLASSSPYQIIAMVLDKFNIKRFFNAVVSGEDFEKGKPSPDIFLKTAAMLGVLPGQCIVIEDSTHGVHAAKAAGMKCIGFANVNSPGQDLSKADLIVDDFRALSIDGLFK